MTRLFKNNMGYVSPQHWYLFQQDFRCINERNSVRLFLIYYITLEYNDSQKTFVSKSLSLYRFILGEIAIFHTKHEAMPRNAVSTELASPTVNIAVFLRISDVTEMISPQPPPTLLSQNIEDGLHFYPLYQFWSRYILIHWCGKKSCHVQKKISLSANNKESAIFI